MESPANPGRFIKMFPQPLLGIILVVNQDVLIITIQTGEIQRWMGIFTFEVEKKAAAFQSVMQKMMRNSHVFEHFHGFRVQGKRTGRFSWPGSFINHSTRHTSTQQFVCQDHAGRS